MASLFSKPKQPKPTDPTKVIGAQNDAIDVSIGKQEDARDVDQQNAFGSTSEWFQNPDGTWGQKTTFGETPQMYATGLAGLGQQYMQGAADMAGNRPDLGSMAAFDQADAFWRQREEPRMQAQMDAERNRLRNMGFEENSEGFKSAMDNLSRQQSDARAGFLNSAQGQFFNQGLQDRGQQVSEFQSLLAPGMQFANQALGTGFSNVPGINVGTVDAAGIYNNNYNQQMQAYQAQLANQNAALGGLASIGGMFANPIGSAIGKKYFS